MSQEVQDTQTTDNSLNEVAEPLPFPFNQQTFCRYEPIEKTIEAARVLIVDDLLRDEDDLSDVARRDWGADVLTHLKRERQIAALALQNIVSNVARLVKHPHTRVVEMHRGSLQADGNSRLLFIVRVSSSMTTLANT